MDAFFSRKNFLVCVDSDGCAMDTMNSKHIRCFGPCLVEEWGLEAWREDILARWNRMNLYARTRGINRFKGLALMLEEVDREYTSVPGTEVLKSWVQKTPALSEEALEQYLEKDSEGKHLWEHPKKGTIRKTEETAEEASCAVGILYKALRWSKQVNRQIQAMPLEEKHAFPGVKEGLERALQMADVVIVSSANRQAVEEEWQRCGLLEYVDLLMTQEQGSKADCIHRLLMPEEYDTAFRRRTAAGRAKVTDDSDADRRKYFYEPTQVLMVGDAMGDLEAARQNGVLFYPILAGREEASWKEFACEALPRLEHGSYAGSYEQQKIRDFQDNFS